MVNSQSAYPDITFTGIFSSSVFVGPGFTYNVETSFHIFVGGGGSFRINTGVENGFGFSLPIHGEARAYFSGYDKGFYGKYMMGITYYHLKKNTGVVQTTVNTMNFMLSMGSGIKIGAVDICVHYEYHPGSLTNFYGVRLGYWFNY